MFKNKEGYSDPTAGEALANICREMRLQDAERRAAIRCILPIFKKIAALSGFQITGRITFRDKLTGKEYH